MRIVILLIALLSVGWPVSILAGENVQKNSEQTILQHRIDFGNTYVLGQGIKSGAVYLMHRKQSDLESMLKIRQDYRQEIIEEFGLEKSALVNNDRTRITPHEVEKK